MVTVVVGAQYGSEGKGNIVEKIASDYDVHVRVGAQNAGHTIRFRGREFKMQQIPCGWINFDATLVLGRGALINPGLFTQEMDLLRREDPDIDSRVKIDEKAGVLDDCFHEQEGGVNGEMHRRIGSTGEGVGPARMARIARDPSKFRLARDVPEFRKYLHSDTPNLIRTSSALLEGTQGFGLSLIHGEWPYCTSNDCTAMQLAADCGISANLIYEVILVARTYPIRVAGNSGPLKGELTWEELSKKIGRPVEERTTVTKKVRRIGTWDKDLFFDAVRINGATSIALTFLDYLFPECEGMDDWMLLPDAVKRWVWDLEILSGVRVSYICTGGPNLTVINRELALGKMS